MADLSYWLVKSSQLIADFPTHIQFFKEGVSGPWNGGTILFLRPYYVGMFHYVAFFFRPFL